MAQFAYAVLVVSQNANCHTVVLLVQGEEHSNEKEGGQKKGRNRGRGKGRGRAQYHNNQHNSRGNHVGTPPSATSNLVSNEQATVAKQPPGPRMPDGTRGFAMGRGKPVAVNTA